MAVMKHGQLDVVSFEFLFASSIVYAQRRRLFFDLSTYGRY